MNPPNAAQTRKPAGKPSLAGLQRAMAGLLMRPLTESQRMAPENAPQAEALITPNDRLSAFERLQIYNQQYWWRLLGNFSEDFRGLRAVLGVRRFNRLANAYLTACGSTSWNLRDLGKNLAAFLAQNPALSAPYSALGLEMARMEWARIEAFDGPEKPPIDPQKIAHYPADALRFSLQPYITLLELQYPVDTLLLKLKQHEIETGSASNAVADQSRRRAVRLSARPAAAPVFMAVHRLEFSVYYKRLEPEAFRLLDALQNGAPLEAACEAAFQNSSVLPEAAARHVQEWFSIWMRLGWLCAPAR